MILIVGLGNPGNDYKETRHNVGFLVLDLMLEDHASSNWTHESKFKSDISIIDNNSTKVILCKPTGFMNLSGISIQLLASFYKISTDNIIVIHDDLDLPVGKVKYKIGGGTGGHNGLKSIDQSIGNNYHRIRIGIGKPDHVSYDISDYVLSKLTYEESKIIKNSLDFLLKEFSLITNKDFEKFKTKLATVKTHD